MHYNTFFKILKSDIMWIMISEKIIIFNFFQVITHKIKLYKKWYYIFLIEFYFINYIVYNLNLLY
jgi:hypothetical protein